MLSLERDGGGRAPFRLACTLSNRRGGTDLLLSSFADKLIARGVRVCGAVQENVERADRTRCDMVVTALPSGRSFLISQDRGPHARGCRLDADGLEAAVVDVAAGLRGGADILIINKFGKHEAEGRGFCQVIGDALAAHVPVLVGVNALNRDAFFRFADGLAQTLEPNETALAAWAETVLALDAA
ncbi:MAG: DUF2478 domain-containing protein [Pseudomonadota bacterium]